MKIDHLVYAGPDLNEALDMATVTLGVDAVPGGRHPGFGTRNHLINLGNGAYLEIIGPDPDQPEPDQPRPFGIDSLGDPQLVAWAARTDDIDGAVATARDLDIGLGDAIAMERQTPSGALLSWRLTPPMVGVIPFLIDWGETPHPTASLPEGAELVGLRLETGERAEVKKAMKALGIEVDVRWGFEERLAATIDVEGSRIVLW